ncbi:MAG: cytochrome c biogenesis heme-transporting ATPase CcmA [Gammaproteobacteria bacterium]
MQTSTNSAENTTPAAGDLLQAQELTCERDERVLFERLNFSLQSGQVMQVKGSNGSGKTTLLRILCGLNQGFEGNILWRGEDVNGQREQFHSELLYIGHRNGVNKVLTPLENLRWSCSLQQRIDDHALLEVLHRVGLRGFEYSQCFTLSAGQQQRVSLARLLVSGASLWVLDEPFTTLDIAAVQQMERHIGDHARAGGSVIVTTHHQLAIAGIVELDLD